MKVSFQLYFPSEPEATRAAESLTSQGFTAVTRCGADQVRWLVIGSGAFDGEDFEAIEGRVQALARTLGGTFDGYEQEG